MIMSRSKQHYAHVVASIWSEIEINEDNYVKNPIIYAVCNNKVKRLMRPKATATNATNARHSRRPMDVVRNAITHNA